MPRMLKVRRNAQKHLAAVLTAFTAVVVVVVVAAPAHGASRDGACNSGEFCYYYNSNNAGSVSDFNGSRSNYGSSQPRCYAFRGGGKGQGKCMKNDAASVWNRSSRTVRVYYNRDYGGAHQDFPPGVKGNLKPQLKNENASHQFLVPAPMLAEYRNAEMVDFVVPSVLLAEGNNCPLPHPWTPVIGGLSPLYHPGDWRQYAVYCSFATPTVAATKFTGVVLAGCATGVAGGGVKQLLLTKFRGVGSVPSATYDCIKSAALAAGIDVILLTTTDVR